MTDDTPPKNRREKRIERMDPDILDVGRAAEALGVSKQTVYKLARAGEVPATRVGKEWRFSRKKLVAWIQAGSQNDHTFRTLLRSSNVRVGR